MKRRSFLKWLGLGAAVVAAPAVAAVEPSHAPDPIIGVDYGGDGGMDDTVALIRGQIHQMCGVHFHKSRAVGQSALAMAQQEMNWHRSRMLDHLSDRQFSKEDLKKIERAKKPPLVFNKLIWARTVLG